MTEKSWEFMKRLKIKLLPMESWRSQRNLSKPSALSKTETKETWELSMAWSWIPVSAQSHVASLSKSFKDSRTFLRRFPWTSLASNIFGTSLHLGVRSKCAGKCCCETEIDLSRAYFSQIKIIGFRNFFWDFRNFWMNIWNRGTCKISNNQWSQFVCNSFCNILANFAHKWMLMPLFCKIASLIS